MSLVPTKSRRAVEVAVFDQSVTKNLMGHKEGAKHSTKSPFSNYNWPDMPEPVPTIRNIAITALPQVLEARELTARITAFLEAQGVRADHSSLYDEDFRRQVKAKEFDIIAGPGRRWDDAAAPAIYAALRKYPSWASTWAVLVFSPK